MRLPCLALGLLLVGAPSAAFADEVAAREAAIIRGSPVQPGAIYGTVGITSADPSEGDDEVRMNRSPWCTGVLIAPTVVITAAHCLEVCHDGFEDPGGIWVEQYWCEEELKLASALRILAGLRTIDDRFRADQVEVVGVLDHFVPPAYVLSDSWTPGTRNHDIAVLRLETPVTVLTPVPLSSSVDDLDGRSATAMGYGLRTPLETDPAVGLVACIPTRPLEPIDSRRLVQESIQMLEKAGYPVVFDGSGLLELHHAHVCRSDGPAPSFVSFEGQVVYLDSRGDPISVVLTDE